MSGKKVSIGLVPGSDKHADAWVSDTTTPKRQPEPSVNIKRLTIDIPEDLHRQLKVKAATEGKHIADLVRGWIRENCGR